MSFSFMRKIIGTSVTALMLASAPAFAVTITGAGATFPYPVYSKWAQEYKAQSGVELNYQSIGSGGGIKQIEAKTVTFGATDSPLKPDELAAQSLVQWPMVMGGIVPVVNLDGVKPVELILVGPVLANVFMGEITAWNDPAIEKLNPGLKLPKSAIAIVHRSDGSGTTFNFTDYLSKVSPEWKSNVGENTSVEWPAGIGAKGNEGVANNVLQTKGSIGYVEYAYALQTKLTYTGLINREGKKVEPTVPAFQAAASNADWADAPGFYQILTNQPGDDSWPITAATFILMQKQPKDAEAAKEALKFFSWAFAHGAKAAADLDYIPIPDPVVSLIKKTWSADIKGTDGKVLLN